jgi:hypothetical protein
MGVSRTTCRRGLITGLIMGLGPGITTTARAQQGSDPNLGNITLTTGVDFPATYVFRGIVQESDPRLTAQPYGDVGLAIHSGDGPLKTAGVNFGLWNSLQTGSRGSEGPASKVWYEERFYSSLTLGFGGGTRFTTTYVAYTSPNGMFRTVREVNLKVSDASRFAPYGILAKELDGQADGGSNEGTYLELGAGPSWPIGCSTCTVALPLRLGLSLNDYYELGGRDYKFGFFDIGALFTLPLGVIPSGYGSWNLHGGVDFLALGDMTKAFNSGDGSKVIGSVGVGLSY